jgi:hypothetical protein
LMCHDRNKTPPSPRGTRRFFWFDISSAACGAATLIFFRHHLRPVSPSVI